MRIIPPPESENEKAAGHQSPSPSPIPRDLQSIHSPVAMQLQFGAELASLTLEIGERTSYLMLSDVKYKTKYSTHD
jgi:hypothetical protein